MPTYSEEELTEALAECAREPVHIPGAIQPAGCLVSLNADLTRVLQVSSNLQELLGIPVDEALSHPPAHSLGEELITRLGTRLTADMGKTVVDDVLTSVATDERCRATAYRSGSRVVVEIELLGPLGELEILTTVSHWQTRLAAQNSEDELLQVLVEGVRALTRHDRVMVYSFDSEWNGQVKAESRSDGVNSLLGHRFPASDIPNQVRALYDINPVRSIPDAKAKSLPLVPKQCPQSGEPLDLSVGNLRAVSPVHQEYLHNMGVAGSLSVAIQGDEQLWGLVACHAMSPLTLSPASRDAAHLLAQMAIQRFQRLRLMSQQRFRQRVQETRVLLYETREELLGADDLVQRHGDGWLSLFRASGVGMVYADTVSRVGKLPDAATLSKVAAWLAESQSRATAWHSDELAETPLGEWVQPQCSCGLLAVPLSVDIDRQGWLMLFREEHRETSLWAGRPEDIPKMKNGRLVMSPRHSFDVWQQELTGHSAPWQEAEVLAVQDLGEDLAIAASASEIFNLNETLYQERQALAEANRRLERLALTDPLTQIWNRYRIETALEAELNAAARYGREVSVLLFDIDHFKSVNDRFGHEVGDRVLTLLAQTVWNALRSCDAVGRWGGEEFLVLCTGCTDEDVMGLASRLLKAVSDVDFEEVGQVTISIGAACWKPGESQTDLIRRADKAMYQAKQGGRNRAEKSE
ncbi:sensor domain-containing diguanylate cyclase [Halomonas sp. I5-271120]|uniref:sensor domain-containing diguanylate cyclase n=1 Tax=Halomonas sp. I5-271120 TaxID=3061632 RepID=UPI002714BB46|nr:sensor domain-containing diguanylate cyclase [Halomonas sp. I5-271120]